MPYGFPPSHRGNDEYFQFFFMFSGKERPVYCHEAGAFAALQWKGRKKAVLAEMRTERPGTC